MNCGIYYIFNIITKKGYLGSSKRLGKRFYEHLWNLRKNKYSNKHLQNSFNIYGEKVFEYKILCKCPEEYQFKLEQWFLDNCDLNKEYNICTEAFYPPKVVFTKEIRDNISKASKVRAGRPEERRRLKQNIINIWNNPKHKQFMKALNRGDKHPQAKINESTAYNIKKEIMQGNRICDTARKYGVPVSLCKAIKYETSWKFLKVNINE